MKNKNICYTSANHIPKRWRAYHVAKSNQKILNPRKEKNLPVERGLFFTLNEKDIIQYSRQRKNSQVYFLDLRNITSTMVQKDYQPTVIMRDGLHSLESTYLTKEEKEEYLDSWYLKHTIPFNLLRLKRYHKKRLDYLIVPGPIEVKS